MMAYSDDHIALAAEYALGTLDADERAQVESMMSVDKDFASVVRSWEHRLGALNQMVGPVEPRPELWEKIRAAVGHSQPQAPLELPETSPPVMPAAETPPVVADSAKVIRLTGSLRRWRMMASVASAVAAALVAAIGVGLLMPDLLSGSVRPRPLPQVAEVKTPPAPKASAQYVALLQKDGGSPAFILTVDEATRSFTVRKVDASSEPGTSFELWLISDKLPKPRSLGVIGAGDFTTRPVLASYDANLVKSATYAVTVEQAGGSPDGNPHSAPLFTGRLIETVPPPAR
jgi:anti-sigma-K factor RskA